MNPVIRVKDTRCHARLFSGAYQVARYAIARSHMAGAAILAGLLVSCAHSPQASPGAPSVPPPAPSQPAPDSGPISYKPTGNSDMDAWRADFSARAVAAGHDRAIVKSFLENIKPLDLYLGSSFQAAAVGIGDQAEFAKPIWDYLKVPLGSSRVSNGASHLQNEADLFDAIEAKYGVDAEYIAAIWGMESSFGAVIGNFDGPNTLANMAVEGRRKSFAEGELLTLMKIVERGDAHRDDLIAGWAGAMGQTQFMPSTYYAYAQDFDGDGEKDVWKNEGDALASAANYLKSSGWSPGQPWGIEVIVPSGFDFSLADGNERRMDTWRGYGIMPDPRRRLRHRRRRLCRTLAARRRDRAEIPYFQQFQGVQAIQQCRLLRPRGRPVGRCLHRQESTGRRLADGHRAADRGRDQGSAGQPQFSRLRCRAWWTAFRAARPVPRCRASRSRKASWQTAIRPKACWRCSHGQTVGTASTN
jgi:lytic murein transglycosylase